MTNRLRYQVLLPVAATLVAAAPAIATTPILACRQAPAQTRAATGAGDAAWVALVLIGVLPRTQQRMAAREARKEEE